MGLCGILLVWLELLVQVGVGGCVHYLFLSWRVMGSGWGGVQIVVGEVFGEDDLVTLLPFLFVLNVATYKDSGRSGTSSGNSGNNRARINPAGAIGCVSAGRLFPGPRHNFCGCASDGNAPTLSRRALHDCQRGRVSLVCHLCCLGSFGGTPVDSTFLSRVGRSVRMTHGTNVGVVLHFTCSLTVSRPSTPLTIVLRRLSRVGPVLRRSGSIVTMLRTNFVNS